MMSEEKIVEVDEVVETPTEQIEESDIKNVVEPAEHLDPQKHFYCLQIKYKQGSKEDELIINRAAMMAGEYMKEQTGCVNGIDTMIIENSYAIATNIASKNENFFAKALYCKYEKYPIGIMLGDYNPVLNIAISATLYIEPKHRTEELELKLKDTFRYWAENTKKASKAFMETLQPV